MDSCERIIDPQLPCRSLFSSLDVSSQALEAASHGPSHTSNARRVSKGLLAADRISSRPTPLAAARDERRVLMPGFREEAGAIDALSGPAASAEGAVQIGEWKGGQGASKELEEL